MVDLNPGLAVTANGAWLKSKYGKYDDAKGYGPESGIYSESLDFTGNALVRSPDFSGGVGVNQTISASDNGEIELAANGYYSSGFYWNPANSIEEPAYFTVGARLSYIYLPWQFRITAFGQNLTDERYHFSQSELDFGHLSTLAYPRTYGVRLNWTF